MIGTSAFTDSQPRWEFLGKRTVKHTLDRDEIYVTRTEGKFKAIKLKVEKSPVRFRNVTVHYANGTKEEIKMRNLISAGGETRVIDLKGQKRIIKRVVFSYDTQSLLGKKAVVRLYGKH
jgi:hypothetical protein